MHRSTTPASVALIRASALTALFALPACDPEPGLFTPEELAEFAKLVNPGDPPPDTSNKYLGDPKAIALGRKFYFDPDFSGPSTALDMLMRPMTTAPRAPKGQRTGVSCATCHDPAKGGADHSADPPGNVVSFGGGAYDVNGQQTVNAAYNELDYWNGRNDSLWSQIVAVEESHVSMAGSRTRVAWRIADAYRAEYEAVFGSQWPLPAELDSVAAEKARINDDGTCKLDNLMACPAPHCHTIMSQGKPYCVPRFPLQSRPGFVKPGQLPVCTWGVVDDLQPDRDAYDCMDLGDQLAVTRVLVNFAKAIAAYEYTLLGKRSKFDQWVEEGPATSSSMPGKAIRGAKLFIGKGTCKECHSGPLLTDNQFHNVGVAQEGTYVPLPSECPQGGWCDCASPDRFEPFNCLPDGLRDGLRKLQASKMRRDSRWSDDDECLRHYSVHTDPNYAAANPKECDGLVKHYSEPLTDAMKGQWKTPGLRNVAQSAPYFHSGAEKTLREVVEHYNLGGKPKPGEAPVGAAVGVIDEKILPLDLSEREIDDLVAFLEQLDSPAPAAITSPPALPPSSNF